METAWSNFYADYSTFIVPAVGVVTMGWVYVGGSTILSYWRGSMIRKARRDHIRVLLVDKFVSDIEDAILSGEISREEAIDAYLDLKKSFPIPDLFPATERLKENIQKRIASGVHAPVEFTPPKLKTMFDKA